MNHKQCTQSCEIYCTVATKTNANVNMFVSQKKRVFFFALYTYNMIPFFSTYIRVLNQLYQNADCAKIDHCSKNPSRLIEFLYAIPIHACTKNVILSDRSAVWKTAQMPLLLP